METKKCIRCKKNLTLDKYFTTQYGTLSKNCYICTVNMSYNSIEQKIERFLWICTECFDDIIEMYYTGSVESIDNVLYTCNFNCIDFELFMDYLTILLNKDSIEQNLDYLYNLVNNFNNGILNNEIYKKIRFR
jgi:hypothetical protein